MNLFLLVDQWRPISFLYECGLAGGGGGAPISFYYLDCLIIKHKSDTTLYMTVVFIPIAALY